jgi:hypothetical protein
MFRKWRMAAGATVLALAAYGATAAVAVPKSAITATVKPAKMDPFTGRMTTQYATLDGTTYYEIVAEGANYCISTNGGGSGTDLVLEGCSATNSSDLWAATPAGGQWGGYLSIFNKGNNNLCIDDVNGEDNIRLPVDTCAAVGGQSWYSTSTDPGIGGACIWENAIAVSKLKPAEDITDDYGDLGDGDWVITLKDTVTPIPSYQTWGGLDTGGCAGG